MESSKLNVSRPYQLKGKERNSRARIKWKISLQKLKKKEDRQKPKKEMTTPKAQDWETEEKRVQKPIKINKTENPLQK